MVDGAGVARPRESGSGVTGTATTGSWSNRDVIGLVVITEGAPVVPCRTAALGKLADLDHSRDVVSQARGLSVLVQS